MADEILLTQEGYDKIVAEHEELVSVRRKEISEKLKEAISYGDLSENAEYDAAKNEQAELEERIFKLEDMIKKAKIIKEEDVKSFSRTALIITLICAFVLTMFANSFISFINNVLGALMPGLAIAALVGRYWKRVTPAAGVACMIISTGFGLCYLLISPLKSAIAASFGGPAIPVALIALAVIIVVTLCTKRPDLSEEEVLDIVLADRLDLKS